MAYCGSIARSLVASLAIATTCAAAEPLLRRAELAVPRGWSEVQSAPDSDTREWRASRAGPDDPTAIVLLERSRESWDTAALVMDRLFALLEKNCPRSRKDVEKLAPAGPVTDAVRGVLLCPSHEASGRGLAIVEDVRVVGDSLIIAKVAFDYEPFSPGVIPLTRKQRALAERVLDSLTIPAATPAAE
jgi:hypothetical protein